MMYKGVVHMVLLYRGESWVVTDEILKVMEGFHHIVDWHIAGMTYWQVGEGVWEW